MKVLIEGAGIAGLSLAALLKKEGIECCVVEKAHQFSHIGYGIVVWDLGLTILEKLQLRDPIYKKSHHIDRLNFLNEKGKSLEQFNRTELGLSHHSILGIERAKLHELLIGACQNIPIRFNTSIGKINEHHDYVRVELSDGSIEQYDCIVGSDGIHSSIRENFIDRFAVRYPRFGIWIFWLDQSVTHPTDLIFTIGGGASALFLPVSKTKCAVYLFKRMEPHQIDDPRDRIERIRDYFKRFDGMIAPAVTALKDPYEIFHDDLTTVQFKTWYRNRVVIIGDAQHALSPVSGMGTSLAMEDAFVLAEELKQAHEDTNLPSALKRFASRRDPRIKQISQFSNKLMRLIAMDSGLSARIRDKLFEWKIINKNYFKNDIVKIINYSL